MWENKTTSIHIYIYNKINYNWSIILNHLKLFLTCTWKKVQNIISISMNSYYMYVYIMPVTGKCHCLMTLERLLFLYFSWLCKIYYFSLYNINVYFIIIWKKFFDYFNVYKINNA